MIEGITGISPITIASPQLLTQPGAAGSISRFGSLLETEVLRVNENVASAELALQKLASGEPVELHDVMITLETARIGVQTFIQVRNRVLEVYQDLTRMQV